VSTTKLHFTERNTAKVIILVHGRIELLPRYFTTWKLGAVDCCCLCTALI